MAEETGEKKPPEEGLTSEERRMLDEASSRDIGTGTGETPAATEPKAAPATGAPEPAAEAVATATAPAGAELTSEETQVLGAAKQEADRVERDELPGMFADKTSGAPRVAEFEESREAPAPEEEAPPREGLLGRVIAAPIWWMNYPFQWLAPAIRMGLGLAGVLLLITLLIVILLQIIFAS